MSAEHKEPSTFIHLQLDDEGKAIPVHVCQVFHVKDGDTEYLGVTKTIFGYIQPARPGCEVHA